MSTDHMTNHAETTENTPEKEMTTEEHLEKISRGTMQLLKPIRAAGMDITELKWDFRNLTGWEYAKAMDCDRSAGVINFSNVQALALFAASAAKETVVKNERGETIHPLDARDIRERIGCDDCAKGIQAASVFFLVSAQVANKRISNG